MRYCCGELMGGMLLIRLREGDIHSTVADITLMLKRSGDINGLVGYVWVLEHTGQHGFNIHVVFTSTVRSIAVRG